MPKRNKKAKRRQRKHRCDNCGKVFSDKKILHLKDTPSLYERLDPGSEVPSGECMECGALTYLVNPFHQM